MITPGYSATATERVLPRMALDFTTAVTDSRVVTTRAGNSATRFNSSGLLEIVNTNLPRYDFNPTTLVCRGQLVEDQRINLFLNSLIDGTNLSTQSVTLSAVAYTVSFYGSGSITISGGHSATVTGIGDFPNRKTYTFTPTAGSSTFTVSGDVKFANLEAGASASSFIPTAATSVTRFREAVTMTGTNFSSWYNPTEGTFAANLAFGDFIGSSTPFAVRNDAATSTIGFDIDGATNTLRMRVVNAGSNQAFCNVVSPLTQNTRYKVCGSYKANNFVASADGGSLSIDTLGTVPTGNTYLAIGSGTSAGASAFFGWVEKLFYWPQSLTNAEVQAFSK